MQYSHHHNDEYHHHRKMSLSDTALLTAVGIIVGTAVLILASEAFAADVRVTRPAATVDSQVNSSANINVGPRTDADITMRSDTDAELRSDRNQPSDVGRVDNDDEDRVFENRSDMNATVRGPLWRSPGSGDDPDNVSGVVRNDVTSLGGNTRNTARGAANAGSISTGGNLSVRAGGNN